LPCMEISFDSNFDQTVFGHSETLGTSQDFLVTSSTLSQTVTAGQTSGPYALRVRPVGASFGGAVNLACTAGLPAGAQCIFNPSTPVTPGELAVDVLMNILRGHNATLGRSRRSPRCFLLCRWGWLYWG